MNKIFILLILIVVLGSCTGNTIYEEPEDLIPKEQMIALLTDIYIANSGNTSPNKLEKRQIEYMPLVYNKYKIDSSRFKRSNIYYTSRIKDYKYIYQEVVKNLEILKESYKKPAMIYDSIQKVKSDSIKKEYKKQKMKNVKKVKKRAKRDFVN